MVVGLVSSVALAAVPTDILDGFEPQSLHHVQMLVILEHFQATPKEFKLAARELDSADEMTAAFYLSRESGKKIQRVLRRRGAGASWWQIMQELDVTSTWMAKDNMRSFQGMQHRNLSQSPKADFKPMTDARFEDLVGAQVTGAFFDTTPSQALDAREQGQSFRDIQFGLYHLGRGQAAQHQTSSEDLQLRGVRPQSRPNQPVPVEAGTPHRPRAGKRPSVD